MMAWCWRAEQLCTGQHTMGNSLLWRHLLRMEQVGISMYCSIHKFVLYGDAAQNLVHNVLISHRS